MDCRNRRRCRSTSWAPTALATALAVGAAGAQAPPADRRFDLAMAAVEEQRWSDAAVDLDLVRRAAPTDWHADEATFWLAFVKCRAGDPDTAATLARTLAQAHAGHAWSGPAAVLLDAIERALPSAAPAAGGMTRSVRTLSAGAAAATPSTSTGSQTPGPPDRAVGGAALYLPLDRGRASEPGLIVDMLDAPIPELRVAGLEMLVLLGQVPDTPTVVRIYLDANRDARRRLIEALASARAGDALREIVDREEDERLQQAAVARLQALR